MHLRGLRRVRLRLPRNGHTSGQQVRFQGFQGQCLCVCVCLCARAREQMRGWQWAGVEVGDAYISGRGNGTGLFLFCFFGSERILLCAAAQN